MKVALIALVLAVSLASSEAWWGYGSYPYYGGYWGGMGMYGGLWGGYGGYGMGYWGKRDTTQRPPAQLMNRTECAYFAPTGVLSCHGPRGVVECSANVTWPLEFDYQLFGVALFDETTTMRYRLLPRRLDNSAWERGVWTDNGVERYASLYFTEEYEYYGLRLRDEKCYNKLVELFQESHRREPTLVTGETKPVYFVGDLMVSYQTPEDLEKRTESEYERRWEGNTEKRDFGYHAIDVKNELNEYRNYNEERWSSLKHCFMSEERWSLLKECFLRHFNTKRFRFRYPGNIDKRSEYDFDFESYPETRREARSYPETEFETRSYPETYYETRSYPETEFETKRRSDYKRNDMWTRRETY